MENTGIANTCEVRTYIEGTYTSTTYVKGACMGATSVKSAYIDNFHAIQHSGIHSQPFRNLDIRGAKLKMI